MNAFRWILPPPLLALAFCFLSQPAQATTRTTESAPSSVPLRGSALQFQTSLTPGQAAKRWIDTRGTETAPQDEWGSFWEQLWRSDEPARRIQELGSSATLIRLSWRELQPEPGKFENSQLTTLRILLQSILKVNPGHRLILSLNSGDEPIWFLDRGGWLSPESPRLFFEFARTVQEAVGELVNDWLTLEEPMSRALTPLLSSDPNVAPETSLADAFEIAFQLARAHRIAAAYLKLKQAKDPLHPTGTVGVAIRAHHYVLGPAVTAAEPHLKNRAAEIAHLAHWAWIQGTLSGTLEFKLTLVRPTPRTIELQRVLPKSDLPPWDSGLLIDWVGLNLGTRLELYPSPQGDMGIEVRWPEGTPQDSQGWPIAPEDHAEIIHEAQGQTSLPLWVTQGGVMDSQGDLQLDFLRRQWSTLLPLFRRRTSDALPLEAYFSRSLFNTPETHGLIHCVVPPLPPTGRDTSLSCSPEESFHFLETQFRDLGT